MLIQTNALAAGAKLTAAPLQPGAEWLRPGDVRYSHGIDRSLLYELIREGKVRSICLRREGRLGGMLEWPQACGNYLATLAKKNPARVQSHRTSNARLWIIRRP